ncbi:MAG: hypothetical protein ACI4J5_01830 [Oscillospiraceae bacterium]
MNEYKASMDKIVPSGSFISETEALMKKIRDEQNGTANNTKTDALPEAGQRIDIDTNSRTIRIKKWTMGLSAAAAVLICAVSLNVYNKANVDSQMTRDADTEASESAASAETEVTAETAAPAEETAEITSVTEQETETAPVTEEPEASEEAEAKDELTAETEKAPDAKTDASEKQTDKKTESTDDISSGFGAEPSDSDRGVNAVNTINDAPVTVYEEEGSSDDYVTTTYSPYGYDHSIESFLYDDVYYGEEEADSDTEYGTPMWVPSFSDEILEEDDADEESFIGSDTEPVPVAGSFEEPYSFSSSNTYTLDVSFRSAASGADEVYVPDTISDLDAGEYYISAEAGFDEYDPVSGTFIVSNGAMFDESVVGTNSSIVNKISGLTASKSQYHFDAETKMYDYRYKLTIYSADESENNAKLFEISFKKGELIINRYDNGTVSSEKYTLTSEEYNDLDSFIGSLF